MISMIHNGVYDLSKSVKLKVSDLDIVLLGYRLKMCGGKTLCPSLSFFVVLLIRYVFVFHFENENVFHLLKVTVAENTTRTFFLVIVCL